MGKGTLGPLNVHAQHLRMTRDVALCLKLVFCKGECEPPHGKRDINHVRFEVLCATSQDDQRCGSLPNSIYKGS